MAAYRKARAGAPAGFFRCEAAGLDWLRSAGGARVVEVLDVAEDHLDLVRLSPTRPTAAAAHAFGRALAVTHDAGAPIPETGAPGQHAAMPPPDAGKPVLFSLSGSEEASFAASAMEMRWLDDPRALGPGRVWMRLRHPLVQGEPLTPLARLVATSDFANGVSSVLPFTRFLFINADLTIHLYRQPHGEWIGMDARTLLSSGGTGLAESVLHDVHGPVGRAFQSLVVQPRQPR